VTPPAPGKTPGELAGDTPHGSRGSGEQRFGPRDPQRERETRRLLSRYHHGGDRSARDQVIERFIPLARSLATRYTRSREPLDDLVQVACVGLVKAVDRFDLQRELTFATFAVPTILGELRRHFRDTGWDLHVPRGLQERALKVEQAGQELSKRLGRSLTPGDIAEATGLSLEEVTEAMSARSVASETMSLDQPAAGQTEGSVTEVIGMEDERFDLIDHTATIEPILNALPERERRILHMRFAQDMTQAEIADHIGVSQMQVSRLLRRSIARLSAVSEHSQVAGGLPPGA
jgi:RNA polymerase sigma-B factor